MIWLLIAVIVVAIFVIALMKLPQQRVDTQDKYPYMNSGPLFSSAERSFLGVLSQAIGGNAQVFGKVRVADVVTPMKGMSRSNWQIAFNKISGKHFDYLLCDKNDLSVLCAIELNDSSHNSKSRKDRDKFLEGVCKAAGIQLIQIPAKATYSISEMQDSLAPYLQDSQLREPVEKSVDLDFRKNPDDIDMLCPRCLSKLVKRTAKKGKNIGKEFMACGTFPKCRHIEAIDM